MKRVLYPVAALTVSFLSGADRPPVPPIDANPPSKLATATFALG